MFCTGAQPVGGGVGAGWRGRRGSEAVSPVQSSSGTYSIKDRYEFLIVYSTYILLYLVRVFNCIQYVHFVVSGTSFFLMNR